MELERVRMILILPDISPNELSPSPCPGHARPPTQSHVHQPLVRGEEWKEGNKWNVLTLHHVLAPPQIIRQ